MDQRQQLLSGATVTANGPGDQLVRQLPAEAAARQLQDVATGEGNVFDELMSAARVCSLAGSSTRSSWPGHLACLS